jgi:multiple sugar transport system permease protein
VIGSTRKRLLIALAFLLPNLLGFLVFTAGPVLFSLYMSFTDWSLAEHNSVTGELPSWIGLDNYTRLLAGDESHLFWDYLWNTVYLMIGIPIGIVGSLVAAMMLNARCEPRTTRGRVSTSLVAAVVTVLAALATFTLTHPGPAPADAASVLSTETGLTAVPVYEVDLARSRAATTAVAVLGAVVTLGLAFGTLFFRTLYYLPTLLAGIAMFLLWKTIYRPEGGLMNAGVQPLLDVLQTIVAAAPAFLWYVLGGALAIGSAVWAGWLSVRGLSRLQTGDAGIAAFLTRLAIAATLAVTGVWLGRVTVQLPERALFATGWEILDEADLLEIRAVALDRVAGADEESLDIIVDQLRAGVHPRAASQIFASAVGGDPDDAALIRETAFSRSTPTRLGMTAGDGLRAPAWLQSETWAKPAIILMGVWLAIGGGNMLLYLAGLSNIPPELYEAAAIDGATGWQRFVHVTWPQLAPTTFFIVIMSTIGGLQGGFEQVMIMTEGKYDTVVLTYYQYEVAFKDRAELGLASAIGWIMFAMIFVMTLLNFRLGSRLTNE